VDYFKRLPKFKEEVVLTNDLRIKNPEIKHRRKNILSGYSVGGEESNTFLNLLLQGIL
jgi:hypothetical protein